ncbi:MAG: tyrosine-type recombinase/integrase [Chitinophagaceae bacterium]
MTEPVATDIQSFFDYLKYEKRYSRHTLISYETDLRAFFAYLHRQFGPMPLAAITHTFVRSWLAVLKGEQQLTAKSINRKISTLRSFFKYHLKRGAIVATPMGKVIAPKISRRLPVFVKETETKQLLDMLNQSAEDWKSLNARMLITLFYATGMRLSELIGLKERQLDFSRSQVRVLGKGNKERIIPVSGELVASIREYQRLKRKEFAGPATPEEKKEEVLLVTEKGKKLYPKYAWLLVNKYLGEVSTLDKKSPHVLRHTFATHLLNQGADLNAVKELLGHASLAATQVYTHNTIGKLKEVHKKAHPSA